MKAVEAVKALFEGKKIRNENWSDTEYLTVDGAGRVVNQEGVREDMLVCDNDDDWE